MYSMRYDPLTGKASVSLPNEDYERIMKLEPTLRDLIARMFGSSKKKK